jgi:hypothetical protein
LSSWPGGADRDFPEVFFFIPRLINMANKLTTVHHETIDWVVSRDAEHTLGIRDRDVRAALDAIFLDFADAARTTVKKWMKSAPWTRRDLAQVIAPHLDGLPIEPLLAKFSDEWLQSHSFQLSAKERHILVEHALRHLVDSLASDFLGDALTASRVAQRSEDISTWCHLLGTQTCDLVCYASFLENAVPQMLFSVQGELVSPLSFVGEMAKRPHAIAGDVETALSMAALRLVRVCPPDPHTSWSWMFPTNQVAGGLAVVTEEPLRTALAEFVDSSVKPGNYSALMKAGLNPIKLHRKLNNKRLREGSLDTTYRLCHELTRCYKEDPAFDARPRLAIVNAIMEETHEAMLVPDHKAADFGPAQRVIGNWMGALGVPNTPEVHELLNMVPAMRQDLHLATVIALTSDNNKRTRRIEEKSRIIEDKLDRTTEELARAKQLAASRHTELSEQIRALTQQLQSGSGDARFRGGSPDSNENTLELGHEIAPEPAHSELAHPEIPYASDPSVLAAFEHVFVFGPKAGRLSSASIVQACASFGAENPGSRMGTLPKAQRGKILREFGSESCVVGTQRGWKNIGLR